MPATLKDQPPSVRAALNDYHQRLCEEWGEELFAVRLFGSRARHEAHLESDVDVCVILERDGWEERKRVINTAADVGLEYRIYISPTVFDRETYNRWLSQERALVMDIEHEGISL